MDILALVLRRSVATVSTQLSSLSSPVRTEIIGSRSASSYLTQNLLRLWQACHVPIDTIGKATVERPWKIPDENNLGNIFTAEDFVDWYNGESVPMSSKSPYF
jgi:hypothetical protein